MIVNLGINRVHRTKSLLIGFLAIFLSHTGFAQDIIFDSGSLTKENNLTSEHPYYSPKAQPLTTDMPSVVSDTANQPESPLFDLTATISEDEIEVATPESLPVINNENELQTPSILTQGGRGELSSNSSDLRDEKNVSTKDNNSELEKQIEAIFAAEIDDVDAATSQQIDTASTQFRQDESYDEPKVSVGLRDLSGVGLLTTGIADWQQREMPFSTLLWSGSEPKHIQYLLKMSEPYSESITINSLVYSSIIRKSAPPIGVAGDSELSHSLIIERMQWLARAGQSEALADLIRKLPKDDERWDEWERWLGAYDLLSYNDSVVCTQADKKVSQEFDAFWLKVQILCQIIEGAYEDALFLAELMNTSGVDDPLFFALLDNFQSTQFSKDVSSQSSLTPLHLILMDLAEAPIEWHQVSDLPVSMTQASNVIKNTTREARLAFAMKQILQKREKATAAAALIRSLYDVERPLETAYSILQNTKGDLRLIASAEIYAALAGGMFAAEIQQDYDLLFVSAFKEEVEFGNGSALLPFYADLARTRLAADTLPIIDSDLYSEFEKIVHLDLLAKNDGQEAVLVSEDIDSLMVFVNADSAQKPSIDILQDVDLESLLPIFEQAGMIAEPLSWLEVASSQDKASQVLQSLELDPILKRALIEAAAGQRTAETILIISALFEKHNLVDISATDLALVVAALQEIGFNNAVEDLVREIVVAHLLDKYWLEEA